MEKKPPRRALRRAVGPAPAACVDQQAKTIAARCASLIEGPPGKAAAFARQNKTRDASAPCPRFARDAALDAGAKTTIRPPLPAPQRLSRPTSAAGWIRSSRHERGPRPPRGPGGDDTHPHAHAKDAGGRGRRPPQDVDAGGEGLLDQRLFLPPELLDLGVQLVELLPLLVRRHRLGVVRKDAVDHTTLKEGPMKPLYPGRR